MFPNDLDLTQFGTVERAKNFFIMNAQKNSKTLRLKSAFNDVKGAIRKSAKKSWVFCKQALAYLFILNPVAVWFWSWFFPETMAKMTYAIGSTERWTFIWNHCRLTIKMLPWYARKYFYTESKLVGASQKDQIRYANCAGLMQEEVVRYWLSQETQAAWFAQAPAEIQSMVLEEKWFTDDVLELAWAKVSDPELKYNLMLNMAKVSLEHFDWLVMNTDKTKEFLKNRTISDTLILFLIKKIDLYVLPKDPILTREIYSCLQNYIIKHGLSAYVIDQIFSKQSVSPVTLLFIQSLLSIYADCQYVKNLRGTFEKRNLWKAYCDKLKENKTDASQNKLAPEAERLMTLDQLQVYHRAGFRLSEQTLFDFLREYRGIKIFIQELYKVYPELPEKCMALVNSDPVLSAIWFESR